MDGKVCTKCEEYKDIRDFFKKSKHKDGLSYFCKNCSKDSLNKWRENNRDKVKHHNTNSADKYKIWKEENKEHIKEYSKEYRKLEAVKERTKVLRKMRNSTNIGKVRHTISNRIKRFLKGKKSKSTKEIIGLEYKDFILFLESKFEDWMTWENYGIYNGEFNYGWDVDHIIPLSTAKNEDDIYTLNYYTNLQPLCSKINRDVKKDKCDLRS